MKVTALGTGGAFSGLFGQDKGNTCFILEADKPYLLDCPKNIGVLGDPRMPVKVSSIDDLILTHLHSDHVGDLGSLLFEKKFVEGKKLRLHTTHGIYKQLKRRLDDELAGEFTRPDMQDYIEYKLEDFVEFAELKPGIANTHSCNNAKIAIRYNWHPTRPENGKYTTIGIKVSYNNKVFAYSGDTKYEPALLKTLYETGRITKKHYKDLMNFLWAADFIVHDATINKGAPEIGNIHTHIDALKSLRPEMQRKIYLVHVDGISPKDLAGTQLNLMERFKTYEIETPKKICNN
jgi:ribonuclease BN (tRNA processing enzyme)